MSPTAIQQAIDVAIAAATEADREHSACIASIESALGRRLLALATAAIVEETPAAKEEPPAKPAPVSVTPGEWPESPVPKPVQAVKRNGRAAAPAAPPPVDGHPAGCPCSVCVLPF